MAKSQYEFEVVYIAQDEGGFTAEVPELPGCISEGDSLEECEKNIHEAVELYLEALEARSIPLPEREHERVYRTMITVTPNFAHHA